MIIIKNPSQIPKPGPIFLLRKQFKKRQENSPHIALTFAWFFDNLCTTEQQGTTSCVQLPFESQANRLAHTLQTRTRTFSSLRSAFASLFPFLHPHVWRNRSPFPIP